MVLSFAVLLCDTPNPAVLAEYGDYLAIFKRFLKSSSPDSSIEYTVDGFDVVNKQEYPSLEDNYDGILLTGSGVFIRRGPAHKSLTSIQLHQHIPIYLG